MSETETVEVIHGGFISISVQFWQELFKDVLTTDSIDIHGVLRESGVFKTIHERLMLPEMYTIKGIVYRWMPREWRVFVEGPDLPILQEGLEYPQVTPIYVRNEDGSTRLVRIDM